MNDLFNQAKALADANQLPECKRILKAGIKFMPAEARNRIIESDHETLKQWFILMAKAGLNERHEADPPAILEFFGAVMFRVSGISMVNDQFILALTLFDKCQWEASRVALEAAILNMAAADWAAIVDLDYEDL
ncbi:MAG: hypothetical protein HQK60_18905 [Deltaproteobacteria bacterium]|nr:hypothetical protein [Deltaproteobacteria bacterium]